jgi:hypothetical protein
MTIVFHNDWTVQKGEKDAKRHQEKVDDAIRKNVRGVIGEESIITNNDRNKKVRVPIRGLKDYRFINARKSIGGVGQGEGKPGDVIYEEQEGDSSGPGGEGHGGGVIEAEVDLEYILEIMFEDLGLPWLEKKEKKSIVIPKGWKFETISKKGSYSRIHKKRTLMEAIQRSATFEYEIIQRTKCNEDDARKALIQAKGDLLAAIDIIQSGKLDRTIEPTIIIDEDDVRFKQIEEELEECSNAVVIAAMDVSGSMTPKKKYLCRSLLFWLVQFLRKVYENVDVRFIQHTDNAFEVDEDTFFQTPYTGGTRSVTAFQKANKMIDAEYPLNEWNIYAVYCSDGEDWDSQETINEIEVILEKLNMLTYIEVKPEDEGQIFPGDLLPSIQKKWKFEHNKSAEGDFYVNKEKHFICSVIRNKSNVWPTLKYMLNIDKEGGSDG